MVQTGSEAVGAGTVAAAATTAACITSTPAPVVLANNGILVGSVGIDDDDVVTVTTGVGVGADADDDDVANSAGGLAIIDLDLWMIGVGVTGGCDVAASCPASRAERADRVTGDGMCMMDGTLLTTSEMDEIFVVLFGMWPLWFALPPVPPGSV